MEAALTENRMLGSLTQATYWSPLEGFTQISQGRIPWLPEGGSEVAPQDADSKTRDFWH